MNSPTSANETDQHFSERFYWHGCKIDFVTNKFVEIFKHLVASIVTLATSPDVDIIDI